MADASGISLSWFGLSLLWLLLGALWVSLEPSLLLGHASQPRMLAVVHVWVLGFLACATFGAVYQLLPVVASRALQWNRLPWVQLSLHQVGLLGMVASFASGSYPGVAIAGSLVLAGVVLFACNVIVTVNGAPKPDITVTAFAVSATWLLLACSLGVVLALNRRFSFLPQAPGALLAGHAHAAVAGFYLSLVQGAAFKLVPMFTLGEVRCWWRVAFFYWSGQAGLVLLVISILDSLEASRVVGACVVVLGLLGTALELRHVVVTRKKQLLDYGLGGFFMGGGFLLAGLCAGLVLLCGADADWLPVVYGLLIILGGLGFMIGGMMFKIVPFLVWMRVYGPRVGKIPVPLASQLSKPRGEQAWFETRSAAIVLVLLGLVRGGSFLAGVGGLLLCLSELLFVSLLLRIAWHLRSRPGEAGDEAKGNNVSKI